MKPTATGLDYLVLRQSYVRRELAEHRKKNPGEQAMAGAMERELIILYDEIKEILYDEIKEYKEKAKHDTTDAETKSGRLVFVQSMAL
jgi:hypothetical protein